MKLLIKSLAIIISINLLSLSVFAIEARKKAVIVQEQEEEEEEGPAVGVVIQNLTQLIDGCRIGLQTNTTGNSVSGTVFQDVTLSCPNGTNSVLHRTAIIPYFND